MKKYKIEIIIICISMILLFVVLNLPFKAKPLGDMDFHRETKNLALYIKGKVPYSEVLITKAPGPVLFFIIPYLLTPFDGSDADYWLRGVIFTGLLITISMLLINKAAQELFGKKIALLTVVLFILFPIQYYYTFGITGEAPAFFAISIGILAWSRLQKGKLSLNNWLLFILGLFLCIMNRPNSIFLLGFGFLTIIITFFVNKEFFNKFKIPLTLSLLAIGILGFLGLKTANIISAGKGEAGEKNDQNRLLGYVMHQGRFQFRNEPADLRYWESDIRPDSKDYQDWARSRDSIYDNSKILNQLQGDNFMIFVKKDIKENLGLFTRAFFIKCIYGNIFIINSVNPENFHLGPLKGKIVYFGFNLLINLINIMIIIGFLLYLAKFRNKENHWPLWAIIASLIIFHAMTYMEPRYLLPSKPGLYILASAGLITVPFINKLFSKLEKILS